MALVKDQRSRKDMVAVTEQCTNVPDGYLVLQKTFKTPFIFEHGPVVKSTHPQLHSLMSDKEEYCMVIDPISDSPAHQQGLYSGDIIVSIDIHFRISLTTKSQLLLLQQNAADTTVILGVMYKEPKLLPLQMVMLHQPPPPPHSSLKLTGTRYYVPIPQSLMARRSTVYILF
jgi:hypothetical protein